MSESEELRVISTYYWLTFPKENANCDKFPGNSYLLILVIIVQYLPFDLLFLIYLFNLLVKWLISQIVSYFKYNDIRYLKQK